MTPSMLNAQARANYSDPELEWPFTRVVKENGGEAALRGRGIAIDYDITRDEFMFKWVSPSEMEE